MLSVTYAKCHISAIYAECRYTDCLYTERSGANVMTLPANMTLDSQIFQVIALSYFIPLRAKN
jgi:hypothetical protein